MKRSSVSLSLLALLSCAPAALPSSSSPPTGAPSPPPTGSSGDLMPMGSASAATPAAPTVPVFKPAYAQEGTERHVRLFRLGEVAVIVTGLYEHEKLYRVDAEGVSPVDGYLESMLDVFKEKPEALGTMTLSGSSLESARAEVNIPGDRGGSNFVLERQGNRWVKLPDPRFTNEYWMAYYQGGLFSAVQMPGGRLLYEHFAEVKGEMTTALDYANVGAGPGPRMAAPPRGLDCQHAVVAHRDLRVVDGALLGLGQRCLAGETPDWMQPSAGPLVVERWSRDLGSSVLEPLPGDPRPDLQRPEFLSVGNELWVRASAQVSADQSRPYLARHDGKAWTDRSPPGEGMIHDVLVTPAGLLVRVEPRSLLLPSGSSTWKTLSSPADQLGWQVVGQNGDVWARFGQGLYLLAAGAESFVPVPLPAFEGSAAVPEHMVFLSNGEGILQVSSEGHAGLMRAGVSKPVVKAPPGTLREGVAYGRVTAATAACKEPFVQLYKLSKVAPPDYDFPLTRRALKGHTEFSSATFLEAQDGPHRYFIARVPDVGVGRKLVTLVQREVKGSTPQVLCGQPARVNRTLKLDLKSGELKK